jgi:hypothetical protein
MRSTRLPTEQVISYGIVPARAATSSSVICAPRSAPKNVTRSPTTTPGIVPTSMVV